MVLSAKAKLERIFELVSDDRADNGLLVQDLTFSAYFHPGSKTYHSFTLKNGSPSCACNLDLGTTGAQESHYEAYIILSSPARSSLCLLEAKVASPVDKEVTNFGDLLKLLEQAEEVRQFNPTTATSFEDILVPLRKALEVSFLASSPSAAFSSFNDPDFLDEHKGIALAGAELLKRFKPEMRSFLGLSPSNTKEAVLFSASHNDAPNISLETYLEEMEGAGGFLSKERVDSYVDRLMKSYMLHTLLFEKLISEAKFDEILAKSVYMLSPQEHDLLNEHSRAEMIHEVPEKLTQEQSMLLRMLLKMLVDLHEETLDPDVQAFLTEREILTEIESAYNSFTSLEK